MFAFVAAVEAFRVQNAIHLGSARPSIRIRTIGPQSGEGFRILPAAFEARPVPGGKRGYFVEKEKLGIVFPPHVAVTSVEVQAAADPGATDVPAFAQSPIVTMKSSATVSQHGSAHLDSNQLTEDVNAIL
jgi:hypothetical protein